MYGTAPDLLRLLVVPVFAWAAVRDVRTRRLPNRLWPPLYLFGLALLAWELAVRWPLVGFDDRLFLIRVAVSLGFVAPLAYLFWRLGGFGGADAKALIAIAIVFPTFPTYILPVAGIPALPAVEPHLGVFSMTVLTNTVLLGACYPIALGVSNVVRGRISPVLFLARPVPAERLPELHGRLFETRSGPTRRGLDLDALRMYLRWRGLTLAELRADPDRYRDPESVTETFDPTDGATHVGPATDGGVDVDQSGTRDGAAAEAAETADPIHDPWAADRFLDALDGTAYGTDAETLREGLETVVVADEVWVSPGMPFVVPMFLGLALGVTYGDLLFALLSAVGVA